MKWTLHITALVFLGESMLAVTACRRDTPIYFGIVSTSENRTPISNAGSDQTIILPNRAALLNGLHSTDPDNNIASYLWTKIQGPLAFKISNANAQKTEVFDLAEGVYQFELKVTDAYGLFSRDTVQIDVIRGAIRVFDEDHLKGQGVMFTDLVWLLTDNDVGGDAIWFGVGENRHELFDNPDRLMQVFVKIYSSDNWIPVMKWNSSLAADSEFTYFITTDYRYNGVTHDHFRMHVNSTTLDYRLVGTKASIWIKFL